MMKTTTKKRLALMLGAFVLAGGLLAGCGGAEQAGSSKKPIKFGVIGPSTGPKAKP